MMRGLSTGPFSQSRVTFAAKVAQGFEQRNEVFHEASNRTTWEDMCRIGHVLKFWENVRISARYRK